MSESLSKVPNAIVIRGARTHNLKNIDVTLPVEKLIVVTGVSGSGKSTLAFDTVFAEGQRRYVESLSAYARQFLERMEKPDVDSIEGICPAIAIRQKNSVRNPRSTVGTTTEIHDYLRLLFARIGKTMCRTCGEPVVHETAQVAAERLESLPAGAWLLLGFEMPLVSVSDVHVRGPEDSEDDVDLEPGAGTDAPEGGQDDAVSITLDTLRRKGFGRLVQDGRAVSFDDADVAALQKESSLHIVVDRIALDGDRRARLTEAIETAYLEGGGAAFAVHLPDLEGGEAARMVFSERFDCPACDLVYELPQPRLFSFNSPFGACPTCHGFGNVTELDMNLVVPDLSRSIRNDAIEPWTKPHYRSHLVAFKRAAKGKVRMDVPWSELRAAERAFVMDGEAGSDYRGIRGFFEKLERKKYKVHVRVFLSRYRGYLTCPECEGGRLRREARDVYLGGETIDKVCQLTVQRALGFFDELDLSPSDAEVAAKVLDEIRRRLSFLSDVGLDYLTLDRLSSSLSGGESQRINLATSLGSSLVGTLYVLDEPSIGLHPRDNLRLIDILHKLRDQGNTVLVVEHDADMIRVADLVVDLGLGAGEQGGSVVYAGSFDDLLVAQRSLTAKYMRDDLAIPIPTVRRKGSGQRLRVIGAREHNLKDIDVEVPLNTVTCVTGVSGSGKSTLVHDVLFAAIRRAKGQWDKRIGAHDALEGTEYISDVVLVDQAPIGRTPRSNPVTYLKAFDPIRELFASTKDARAKGFTASHFSFNVHGGRCEACEGEGQVRVEMQFLADVFVPCEHCDGRRFKPQVLDVRYRGHSIDKVLQMTVREALSFFNTSPKVLRRLVVLGEIGLGYLRLGQPATTLSGGEAQRVKIAAHLTSRGGDRILYIMDEPTTGLHFDDIAKLQAAFGKLIEAGHSLLVIEHNLDIIKTADWVIDLGPDGGDSGGSVVAVGTPEHVAGVDASHTGRHLRIKLAEGRTHAYAGGA